MRVLFLILILLTTLFSREKPIDCPTPLLTSSIPTSPFLTAIFQPNSTNGNDAYYTSITEGTSNDGVDQKLIASAWTKSAKQTYSSFLLQFDYSSLPSQ